MRDPHAVLGVPKSASDAEVKSAYRKLAKQYHPDMHPGDAQALERFRLVCEAYDALRGELTLAERADAPKGAAHRAAEATFKRAQRSYAARPDSSKTSQRRSSRRQPPPPPKAENAAKKNSDDLFSDLVSGLKSAGKKAFGTSKTDELPGVVNLTFEEAALGTTKRVRLPDGKSLDVRVPGGVEDAQQIRLRGGPNGQDGQQGSQFITVKVAKHDLFKRHGTNVHLELPISVDEAVLGSKISVPTVDGSVMLTLPAGSNADSVFRLRSKGAIIRNRTSRSGEPLRGDQYVSVKIVLPEPSDREFTKLVKRWAGRGRTNIREALDKALSNRKS